MNPLAELLEANERFYAAFNGRDLVALAELWDDSGPVACIHPGWRALTDRHEILESWRAIFQGGGPATIDCRAPEALLLGGGGGEQLGMVVCYEAIGNALLVATNLFREVEGNWRLVHHQAGPCNEPPAEAHTKPPLSPLQ